MGGVSVAPRSEGGRSVAASPGLGSYTSAEL